MTIIISVEGNIGSGKTTLLQELEGLTFSKPHVVVLEQVGEWTDFKNSKGENILELFYSNQEKYSYMFQSYVLFSRVQHILRAIEQNPDGIVICERCHLTDLMIFARSLFELQKLNEMEWIIYQNWHQMIRKMFEISVTAVIYNRAHPDICASRIAKRNRSGESDIPLSYLELIHQKHDDWLISNTISDAPVDNILLINGDQDHSNKEERDLQLISITNFVNNLLV